MLLNCGVGEDSWESVGLQGDQTSQWRKSILNIHWKNWCCSWSSNTLAPMQKTDSLEKTLMLGNMKVGGEGNDRGWDGCMVSPIPWTWVWASPGSWWWTGRPGVLQSMGLLRVGHDGVTEWTEFFSTHPSLWSDSHFHTWLLEKPQLWLYRYLSANWCLCFLILCLGLSELSFQGTCLLIPWLMSLSVYQNKG